jgi:hypothetical protein
MTAFRLSDRFGIDDTGSSTEAFSSEAGTGSLSKKTRQTGS